jgi:hypothetical protein
LAGIGLGGVSGEGPSDWHEPRAMENSKKCNRRSFVNIARDSEFARLTS